MKKQYETPEMELIQIENDDVITASGTGTGGNETGWVDQF